MQKWEFGQDDNNRISGIIIKSMCDNRCNCCYTLDFSNMYGGNMKKQLTRPLTFEQEMQLRTFYKLKSERQLKRVTWFTKECLGALKSIGRFYMSLVSWFVVIFISVMVGYASETIVYALNKPFGLGYAHFASYALTALTFLLLKGIYMKDTEMGVWVR